MSWKNYKYGQGGTLQITKTIRGAVNKSLTSNKWSGVINGFSLKKTFDTEQEAKTYVEATLVSEINRASKKIDDIMNMRT